MENKQEYEIVLVFGPKAGEEPVKKTVDKLLELGLVQVKLEHLGPKPLVYRIEGNDKADFWVLEAKVGKKVNFKEVNLYLNRNTDVIRYLILKKPDRKSVV